MRWQPRRGAGRDGMDGNLVQLAGFKGDSIVDGPGLRCVVFAQGCPHKCPGCHNPDTQDFTGGESVTVERLFEMVKEYPLCKAVTLSGGEPFAQAGPLYGLAVRLKEAGYELAAYSGYTLEELQGGTQDQQMLLSVLDTLIDGRFVQAQRSLSLRFKGSANQRILNVQKSLREGKPVLETAIRWTG